MEIEIEVVCDTCGATLSVSLSCGVYGLTASVEPCEECVGDARQEGYDEGRQEGHDEGYQEGYDEGAVSAE